MKHVDSLTMSVGQELGSGMAGWLQLWLSHEFAARARRKHWLGLGILTHAWSTHLAGKLLQVFGRRSQFFPRRTLRKATRMSSCPGDWLP